MFLTHIDEDGNDSPAILIENATAANRAVNLPEFVNVPPGGLVEIAAPATEFYRLYDSASELTAKGEVEAAIVEWARALAWSPDDARCHNNIGDLLLRQGKLDEAASHFQRALDADPEIPDARDNLGLLLLYKGKIDEAITQFQRAIEINPRSTETRVNLGGAFLMRGEYKEALAQLREALRLEPDRAAALSNTAWILATCPDPRIRNGAQAVGLAERAARLSGGDDPAPLDILATAYAETGRFAEAVQTARRAVALATQRNNQPLAEALRTRTALYEAGQAFRETK